MTNRLAGCLLCDRTTSTELCPRCQPLIALPHPRRPELDPAHLLAERYDLARLPSEAFPRGVAP